MGQKDKETNRQIKNSFKDEKKIYDFWEKEKFFLFNTKTNKKVYALLMPPPNLTGELHLGHALQHSIMDAIARYRRLQGFEVLLLPGVDHAGIQFEGTLEKKLSKEGKTKKSLGREEWLEEAWKFKEEVYKSFHEMWTLFGISADWSREVFTLDEGQRKAVFEEFKTFWDRGLIYKGPYIVQWCPKCNTAIEDVEMEYQERREKLYFVRYKLEKSENEYIEVATTRPETIFADSAIAIYPNHKKFKKFVGSNVINPLTGTLMPVIKDKRVEKDFGTGALKITPAHDILDYEIGRDNKLEVLQAIDKSGRLTERTGNFSGLKVGEAKEKVVDKLKEIGALVSDKDYVHSVAVCERCKSVVEPLISEEWFLKMKDIAKEGIAAIKKDDISFLPKTYKNIILDWLGNLHDWCISRSLWWGHRIPVWYRNSDKGKVISKAFLRISDKSEKNEMKVALELPGEGWVQDEQVLDTWFSSGLWPLSTLGWEGVGPVTTFPPTSARLSEKSSDSSQTSALRAVGNLSSSATHNSFFDKYFPWDFEISAPEIKYLWIARMIMLSVYFTGKVPFKTMFFHGMLRDLEGRKFSKSLGNGIEPGYLVDKWGVDAARMVLYTYSIPGRDGRVNKAILDERGKNFRNFGTKLRNIARFVLELKDEETKDKGLTTNDKDDTWILGELEKTAKKVTKNLDKLELHLAVDELYEFVWHKFADKYIESTKERRGDAQPTLENVLKQVLILLHPFMPFLTEEIYQKFAVKKNSIMLETWPSL